MDDTQQLLLWRWSTLVQLTSLAMIAGFFALLARDNRRVELRRWSRAWIANFLALVVTSAYWVWQPAGIFPLVSVLYLAAKAAFVLLLIEGAWVLVRPGSRLLAARTMTIGIVAYAVVGGLALRDLQALGIVHHAVMGSVLTVFSLVLWRMSRDGVLWLAAGIGLRGLLSLAESAAYLLQSRAPTSGPLVEWLEPAGAFLSTSSSFDTGAEWLVVLGCVLAMADRARRELEAVNSNLLNAQQDLRRLADRDPLTALVNRRSLPEIFRAVQPHGALLLFFDLDGFKQVNDLHGHAAGDGCLKLFASALKESFRPDDHVIRYGGDEFLVVASGLDRGGARTRIAEVNRRMQRTTTSVFACGFSVGMAELPPGGQPDAALEEADHNMYKAKNSKRDS